MKVINSIREAQETKQNMPEFQNSISDMKTDTSEKLTISEESTSCHADHKAGASDREMNEKNEIITNIQKNLCVVKLTRLPSHILESEMTESNSLSQFKSKYLKCDGSVTHVTSMSDFDNVSCISSTPLLINRKNWQINEKRKLICMLSDVFKEKDEDEFNHCGVVSKITDKKSFKGSNVHASIFNKSSLNNVISIASSYQDTNNRVDDTTQNISTSIRGENISKCLPISKQMDTNPTVDDIFLESSRNAQCLGTMSKMKILQFNSPNFHSNRRRCNIDKIIPDDGLCTKSMDNTINNIEASNSNDGQCVKWTENTQHNDIISSLVTSQSESARSVTDKDDQNVIVLDSSVSDGEHYPNSRGNVKRQTTMQDMVTSQCEFSTSSVFLTSCNEKCLTTNSDISRTPIDSHLKCIENITYDDALDKMDTSDFQNNWRNTLSIRHIERRKQNVLHLELNETRDNTLPELINSSVCSKREISEKEDSSVDMRDNVQKTVYLSKNVDSSELLQRSKFSLDHTQLSPEMHREHETPQKLNLEKCTGRTICTKCDSIPINPPDNNKSSCNKNGGNVPTSSTEIVEFVVPKVLPRRTTLTNTPTLPAGKSYRRSLLKLKSMERTSPTKNPIICKYILFVLLLEEICVIFEIIIFLL